MCQQYGKGTQLKGITGIKPAKLNGDKNERKGEDKGDTQVSSVELNQMMSYQEKKKKVNLCMDV